MDEHGQAAGAASAHGPVDDERSCKGAKPRLVQIGKRAINNGDPERVPGPPRDGLRSAEPSSVHAQPRYWQTIEELNAAPRVTGEFPGGLPAVSGGAASGGDATRRDFLSLTGFSLAAAGLAACRAPVQHAVPLVAASDTIVPGVSNYYATTCGGCSSSCSLVVKQRDGRPIKIDGNDESQLFGGGTCASGQATVLSLYDDERLRGPVWQGQPAKWREVDEQITAALAKVQAAKRKTVLLTGTITSPSTRAIIDEWKKRPGFRHVSYDAMSASAIRAANAQCFGRAVVPHYAFDKARVVVALEADFLGTWLSPVEFARQYAKTRSADAGRPALHVQVESGFSVTGSNADARLAVAPSQIGAVALALFSRVARKAGTTGAPEAADPVEGHKLDGVADELWKHRRESLVVSGSQDVAVQVLVNALNVLLGNVGETVDLLRPSLQRQGDEAAVAALVDEMNRGDVGALIVWNANPVYDYPDAERFKTGLEKVALTVSLSDRRDETSSLAQAICPDHHFLESWGDAEPVESHFSLAQPLIAPLFDTRAGAESLLRWSGDQRTHYAYLRTFWQTTMFPRQSEHATFDAFWDHSLQHGVVAMASKAPDAKASPLKFHGDWKAAAAQVVAATGRGDGYELHLYESIALREGSQANNPWLQELPDPITKVTWGNYAAVSPQLARKLGLEEADVVTLKTDAGAVDLPVFIQPGQDARTISVAVGYGRRQVGKAGANVGVNVYPLAVLAGGVRRYAAGGVALAKTGRREPLGNAQTQFSMADRPIAIEATYDELQRPAAHEGGGEGEGEGGEKLPTLWQERKQGLHAWGMAIDLNACTGCSACVVSCQAENNVPVVGKDQIQRVRIMHWMRIDRYYSGSEDNPKSVHQPMMCQHCQHAPCETVCPVLATTTTSEGLNAQTYNRCIGTRYCANNCPYKVRRFNWYNYTQNPAFDYNMESPLGRMVLNPDVAVRSRGVMEKCSLCVQRIQLGKTQALQDKKEIADGDVQTACQQSCPTGAIVFGDLMDPESRVSKLLRSGRSYRVLEDLGTRPNVGYLKKVRNGQEI